MASRESQPRNADPPPKAPHLQLQTPETGEPESFWREKKTKTSQSKGLGTGGTLDISSSNRQKTIHSSQNTDPRYQSKAEYKLFRLARTQEIIFQPPFLGKLLEDVLHQNEGVNQES